MKKGLLSFVGCVCVGLSVAQTAVFAAKRSLDSIEVETFPTKRVCCEHEMGLCVYGNETGYDFSAQSSSLIIYRSGEYTISNAPNVEVTNISVYVSVEGETKQEDVNITLNNVNIDVSNTLIDGQVGLPALAILDSNNCDVNITLAENSRNVLKGGKYCAGLAKCDKNNLTIKGNGKLEAFGGEEGPGVGNNFEKDVCNINIEGGNIEAHGGDEAAGIGSGANGDAKNININGGTVNAFGIGSGAGIGGGWKGNATHVNITGGTVVANGGKEGGAGIGGGYKGNLSDTKIEGGHITAIGGEKGGAGIGGGYEGDVHRLSINGKNTIIKATGGKGGAGIGGGYKGSLHCLSIRSGNITANGKEDAAGIGGGSFGNGWHIWIFDGIVRATGEHAGAGIGGGRNGTASNIVVLEREKVEAKGGTLLIAGTQTVVKIPGIGPGFWVAVSGQSVAEKERFFDEVLDSEPDNSDDSDFEM